MPSAFLVLFNTFLLCGLVIATAMWFVALHNLFWCLQEFFCLSHLGLQWQAFFRLPENLDLPKRALRAQRNLARQLLNLVFMVALWHAWWSNLTEPFDPREMWLTILGTVIIGWQLVADAGEIDLVRER